MGRPMMHQSRRGQAIDELGMICASLAFLYVVLEVGHLESWRSTWGELRAVVRVGDESPKIANGSAVNHLPVWMMFDGKSQPAVHGLYAKQEIGGNAMEAVASYINSME